MTRRVKVGLVGGGYLLAIAAAALAGALYNARMSAMPYDTSGGMYAGGELLLEIGVFLVVALVPTLLWLWFLRSNARLWQWLGVLSVAFAVAGLVAVLSQWMTPKASHHPALMLFELFGLAQLLGVPIWMAGFVLFAILAPTRSARRLLLVAVGLESVIAVFAAIHWFASGPRH